MKIRFIGGELNRTFGFNQSSTVWVRDADQTRTDISLDATNQTFGVHVRWADGQIDIIHNGAVIELQLAGHLMHLVRLLLEVTAVQRSNDDLELWSSTFLTHPVALGDETAPNPEPPAADIVAVSTWAITGPGTGGFGVYNEGGAVLAAQDADLTNFVGIASQTQPAALLELHLYLTRV